MTYSPGGSHGEELCPKQVGDIGLVGPTRMLTLMMLPLRLSPRKRAAIEW
jgi:hypothetical protein